MVFHTMLRRCEEARGEHKLRDSSATRAKDHDVDEENDG